MSHLRIPLLTGQPARVAQFQVLTGRKRRPRFDPAANAHMRVMAELREYSDTAVEMVETLAVKLLKTAKNWEGGQ
jgi:hypothetical protein